MPTPSPSTAEPTTPQDSPSHQASRLAPRFAAIGHEVRLRALRLLLAAHPDGLVAGQLQEELEIPASTLSHHLETLLHDGLVRQTREGRFLRYTANTETLKELLDFLYAECCTRNPVLAAPTPETCC